MHFLGEAVVFILTSYLALTNHLAVIVSDVLSLEEPALEESMPPEEANIVSLPSIFDGSLTHILRQSSEYQAATVGAAAGLTESATTDPLEALVNIFCTFTTTETIRTTTGSGFFIDPDGIIMTNAHIAQFLLLEQTDSFGDATCTVRTGSPASARYEADLLYIPPMWVAENASLIRETAPTGTGERDYALLYVNADVEEAPLPAAFPALPIDTELLPVSTKGAAVQAAGYPAGDLLRQGASTDLLARIADTTVSELYTFGSNYADVFSVKGSQVGAQGASGGPIVNSEGNVIGMIATRGDDETDGPGSLRAITLSHIDRTITEESGFTLREQLNGNLPYRASVFSNTMSPFLLQLLERG